MQYVLHSDQGQKFEGTTLRQTLEAFGIATSHTTAYQKGSMNRLLLLMFHCFVEKQHDWERYLVLVIKNSTSCFNKDDHAFSFMLPPATAFKPGSYSAHLQAKLAGLHHFVTGVGGIPVCSGITVLN